MPFNSSLTPSVDAEDPVKKVFKPKAASTPFVSLVESPTGGANANSILSESEANSRAPLADTLESVRQLEDAGASAIVMRSLFEEQILQERYGSAGFAFGPDRYLEQLRRIKARVSVPVIASINGTTTEGWLKYARLLQRAEADAIELNFYHLATDPAESAASVEGRLLDIVAVLKESVAIPLAVKLSPFYSSLPNLAARLERIGAQGLVLFNRFYQGDIDPNEPDTVPSLRLSTSCCKPRACSGGM